MYVRFGRLTGFEELNRILTPKIREAMKEFDLLEHLVKKPGATFRDTVKEQCPKCHGTGRNEQTD